jgi:small subunit ribosomal protein S2
MSLPTLQQLLEAGCHFGHLSSRWNPQMKPFIFMEKNGVHVMDLKKTQAKLAVAADEIRKIASRGDHILLVGTKKQAQDIIRTEAERSSNFYVVERWLGGQLTNFATVKRSVRKWKTLEKKSVDGTYDKITKKEILDIERQKEKLSRVLGGIAEMRRIPGAVFVVDTLREHIAIKEAKKLGIPVFAIVDTNSNPNDVDYAIPANDDASKSISLLTKTIVDAFLDGASKVKAKKDDTAQVADKKPVKKSTKSPAAKVAKAEAQGKETNPEAVEASAAKKDEPAAEKAPAKKAPAKKAADKPATDKPAAK